MARVILALALVTGASAAAVTPVQKVIQLMEGMMTKGKEEKHAEQVQFAAYKQFCDDTTVEKTRLIKEAAEKIEVLTADIEGYTAAAEQLAKEIASHDEDISAWTGDVKAATKVRDMEKATYDKTHTDYSESIDALERAINVLKKQSHDRPQALIQLQAVKSLALFPAEAKKTIDAFLQEDDDLAAPEANGYEFQSNGVIEMLEKLNDKFVGERTALEKEEANTKHNFDMLIQDLTAEIEQATQDSTEKTETKASKLEAKAKAESDLQDTSAAKAADEKYLADLTATCEQKSSDFEARQQLRSEELEAIAKAIEIVSSGAVSGSADKHLPALVQRSSLAQLRRSETSAHAVMQSRVATMLRQRAEKLGSRLLAKIADAAEADPFKKVKKMIKDLIVRLMEEANEEAEHKGWCDTELSTNEQTRKEKTEAVETLHAEIDQLEASIAKLTEDISNLSKAVSELDAAVAEATKIRGEEKEKNAWERQAEARCSGIAHGSRQGAPHHTRQRRREWCRGQQRCRERRTETCPLRGPSQPDAACRPGPRAPC